MLLQSKGWFSQLGLIQGKSLQYQIAGYFLGVLILWLLGNFIHKSEIYMVDTFLN